MSRPVVHLVLSMLLLTGAVQSLNGQDQAPSDSKSAKPASQAKWESLLAGIEDGPSGGVAGDWSKERGELRVGAATGARLALAQAPEGEYDFRISFTRNTGVHSIAMIFPHGSGHATFEIDAWGQHLGGIQNIAGQSIRENPTRQPNLALINGRRYAMTVEVRRGEVRTFLNDRLIATHRSDGSDLATPDLWSLPDPRRLGIGAWDSATTFHSIEFRKLGGDPSATAKSPPVAEAKSTPRPRTPQPKSPLRSGAGKRALLVIANYHFFYREYSEPREEMERAGIRVTVAAGRRERCTPHTGSGEGSDRGIVMPDIALADAKADDYDAILFSGGWGSSAYQFAFDGRYNTPAYNGDRAVKSEANRLINEFVEQDKYVCALCNAVSVLAWARVDGQSPLRGKRVCAPTREAAAGIYNGRQAQPSCRWHPEANGAILSPAGALGRPGTAIDDVLVDGKIVTGEDDISAREMGRRIVQLLSQAASAPRKGSRID